MRKRLLFSLLLYVSTPTFSDVFGLKGGMPLDELKKKMEITQPDPSQHAYVSFSVPVGNNPYFKMYVFYVMPKCGLVTINAMSKDIQFSKDGHELTEQFGELMKDTSDKYGKGRLEHFKNKDKPTEQLEIEDIDFAASWGGKGEKKLPDNLGVITLQLKFNEDKTSIISETFLFKNIDKCVTPPS